MEPTPEEMLFWLQTLWTEFSLTALQIPEIGSWSRQQGCRKAYRFKSPLVCTPSLVQMLSWIKVKMKYWISEMLKFWISQNFDLFCLFRLDFCSKAWLSVLLNGLMNNTECETAWKKILIYAVARTTWLVWKTRPCPHSALSIFDSLFFLLASLF